MAVVSSLSVGWGVVVILSSGSPDHVSVLSGGATWARIRPVLRDDRAEGAIILSGFPLRFRCRRWLLGHPVPARELGFPHGWLTGPRSGPGRGVRVPHVRAAIGVGALSTPGTAVLALTGVAHRPAPAAFSTACPCTPPHRSIYTGLCLTKHQPRVHASSPVRSSARPWLPDGTAALRLSPELRTPLLRATHVGVGDRSSSTDLNQRSMSST
jgi:hypothetical protein